MRNTRTARKLYTEQEPGVISLAGQHTNTMPGLPFAPGKALLLLCLLGLLNACTTPGFEFNQDDYRQTAAPAETPVYSLTPIDANYLLQHPIPENNAPIANPELQQALTNYRYHVGPHDILTITVWDHPELTIPAGQFRDPKDSGRTVDADGNMYFPYVGELHVAGLTTSQIREKLGTELARYIRKPQLDVNVAAFRSQWVYITGEIAQPGLLPVTDLPMTLLDAINLSGGVTETAELRHVVVTRAGDSRAYDVYRLLHTGELSENLLLKPGDIVHVPDARLNRVHVIGEVHQSGSFPMYQRGMNLAEALGAAGGINLATADPGQIFVFRNEAGKPHIYWLDASSPVAMVLATRFALQPQDVVYVASVSLTGYNRALAQILPTIQALWQTTIIERELDR